MLHTHKHTHTHTHHGIVEVWPPARQCTAAVCKRCELPVRDPHCDLRLDQGRLGYDCQRVRLPDGGRVMRRAKREDRKFYGGWYKFYGKSSVYQTGLKAG